MPPFVIPIFIIHQGCPHTCIFCNQQGITGHTSREGNELTSASVRKIINEQLGWSRKRKTAVQVAFYGGSFTGLPKDRQEEFLGAVKPYIESGLVDAIRLSTRPDYIDLSTALFLRKAGVETVELGIQSMDPAVLQASVRGHTATHVKAAFTALKEAGLKIGAQLMVGLPGEKTKKLIQGTQEIIRMAPDFARVYPALVMKGSGLETLYRSGKYLPLTLNRAVGLAARLKLLLDDASIPVIRLGLQPSLSLEKECVAGPYHPAFGELVLSRILFKKVRKILSTIPKGKKHRLCVAAADQSVFRGSENKNLKRLQALGLMDNVELVFGQDQPRQTINIVNVQKHRICTRSGLTA